MMGEEYIRNERERRIVEYRERQISLDHRRRVEETRNFLNSDFRSSSSRSSASSSISGRRSSYSGAEYPRVGRSRDSSGGRGGRSASSTSTSSSRGGRVPNPYVRRTSR